MQFTEDGAQSSCSVFMLVLTDPGTGTSSLPSDVTEPCIRGGLASSRHEP